MDGNKRRGSSFRLVLFTMLIDALSYVPLVQKTIQLLILRALIGSRLTDTDRARKHGMEEYISADPVKFEHAQIFKYLQTLTLDFRLSDPFCSLVNHSFVFIFNLKKNCG